MKTNTRFLILIATLFLTFSSQAQRAKDGDFVVGAANTIVNSYTHLTANATAGATSINVNDGAMVGGVFGGALAPGDLIMIIQMQGALTNIDTRPVTDWGDVYTVPSPYLWTGDWYNHIEEFGALNWTNVFGNPQDGYGNAGKFEQVEVLSVSGNTINLQCGLQNDYNVNVTETVFFGITTNTHVQIVRVPRFNNLTVQNGASIIPTLWNGDDGGIVALEVEATLDVNAGGAITADDSGFRGGELDASGQSGGTGNPLEARYLGSSNAFEGSERGESIMGYHTEYDLWFSRYGMGAVANGGGGGGFQNAGGGGGSNVYIGANTYTGNGVPDPAYTATWNLDLSHPPYGPGQSTGLPLGANISPGGGRGGYALSQNGAPLDPTILGPRDALWGGDARKTNGGRGGHALTYDPTRLFFGGGGGAGDQDSGEGGAGGRGGGIVYITCYGTVVGGGTISANGEDGQDTNPSNTPPDFFTPRRGNDGAGGGGAGGSIYIENANPLPGTLALNAIGGNGGDQVLSYFGAQADEAGGPGGGGSGGTIAHNGGAAAETITGGISGSTNSSHMVNFPLNGATGGHTGAPGLSSKYYDITSENDTICAGGTANLTATILGTLPGGSTVEWYTQQFGGASVNTGLTYSPSPAVTTTYYIGVCPGTFRTEVTVVVNTAPNLVVNDPLPVCAPATVDITLPAVTAGSDPGTLTYWTDMAATMPYGTPTAATNGIYYIQLDAGGGCTTVQPVNVVVNPQDDASFTMTPTCDGGTATVTGTPGGTWAFNPAPGDGATINGSGTVSNGTLGNTYFVEYTTTGACPASSIESVTAASDLAYTPTLTDENCGAGDGVIDLVATGGDGGPYQYSIDGGVTYQGSGNFTGLSAGSFNISILDGSGCEVTGTESLSSSGGPTIDNITPTNPTCAGACDGSITVTVSGGTPPYSYQWYDVGMNPIGPDAATITGICAGDYSVEVTDASGGMVFYFDEDFGTDGAACTSQGTVAAGYNSGAGAWTVQFPGANDVDANLWYVSTMETGVGAGNCSDGCGVTLGHTDRTLHISSAASVIGDQGAAYFNGGACPLFWCALTDTRAVSPSINTMTATAPTLTFDYIHEGDGIDQCEFLYSIDDGVTWVSLGILPNTITGACAPQHTWAQYSMPLPAPALGINTLRLGYRWTNNDDGVGNDPSVAIDNIQISESSAACPANANTTLVDPPAINITNVATTDPSCNGATDGSIDITASGGTGALTYSIDNGVTFQAGNLFNGLGAATYDIVVEDASGCQATTQVTLNDPAAVNITNVATTDPTCGNADGSIDVTASGGTGALTYSIDNGVTFQAGNVFNLLGAATYDIVVEDANGCQATTQVTLTDQGGPSITNVAVTDPSCNGVADGSIDITASGGTGALSYSIDNGVTFQAGNVFNSLGAATYDIVVEDINGCQAATQATLTDPPAINITNIATTDPTCNGDADGSIDITASGGTGALSYSIDNGVTFQAGNVFNTLGAATYDIVVEDANGCQATTQVTLTDPIAVSITNVGTIDPTCNGATDGSIGILAAGGTGVLQYSIDNGVTFQAGSGFTGLGAATYDIVVEDANGCQATTQVTLNDPPAVNITNIATTDPTCGNTDGSIDITASGGTGALTYSIDNGVTFQAGNVFNTLGAATYDIVVEDANGCQATTQATLTDQGGPSITNVATTDPSCNGATDGSIDITASGGTGALSYSIDNGVTFQAGNVFNTLGAATYDIVVEDANGCQASTQATLTDPPAVNITNVATTDPSCNGGTDGSIDITASGGTGALTYSIDNGVTFQAGNVFNTLGAATYDIVVEDANGCQASTQATLIDPPAVSITNVATTDPTCGNADGSIDITASGGTGALSYSIDNGVTFQAGNVFNTLGAATYDIVVEDANGCQATTQVTLIDQGAPTITNVATTDPSCNGGTDGSIDITAAGGTGALSYSIDNGVTFQAGNVFNTLGAATYDIVVEDANGCQAVTQATLTDPPAVNITNLATTDPSCNGGTDGSIDVTTSGGTGALSYSIDNGVTFQAGNVFNTLGAATYDIVVEDANGCQASTQATLTDPPVVSISNVATVDPTCGNTDGSIDITAAGGTGALQYSIDNGVTFQVGNVFNTLGAGLYDVVVEDANGCQASTQIQLNNVGGPVLIVNDPSAVCDPATVDLTLPAVTAGSDPGTLTYWTDAGATMVLGSPNAVATTGTYYIMLDAGGGCTSILPVNVTVNPQDDASFTLTPTCDGAIPTITGLAGGTFAFNTPPADAAVIDGITGVVSGGSFGGTYDVIYTTNGACPNSSSQTVTALDADDPTFTMTPTCDGGTAAVTGVPGGTFSFNIPPADAAVIDPMTGTVSGGTPGGTYSVLYTTPGPCVNSIAVQFTADTDDPTFTLTPTCDGATATILGTTGGTFSFNVAPVDAAVIDPNTGLITGGTTGSTYDVEYTTGGPCSATMILQVTVPALDDATFALTPTCDGATAIVSGTPGGTFSFTVAPGDGAVIDAATGTITLGTSAATYDVTYTTNGGCPANSNQTVTVLTVDDASFTTTPTCDGATSTITGTPGGVFSFDVAPGDAAVIDAATGTVTNGSPNGQYMILYTTNGSCPANSVELVVASDCTDEIVIPTAITPNGDLINDTWDIQGIDLKYPDAIIRVYNRWGNLIFEHSSSASDPYSGNMWDGTYNGQKLPVSSFYYIIDHNDGTGDSDKGTVSIVERD